MRNTVIIGGAGLGLVGGGLYGLRRRIFAYLLKLPPARNRVQVERGLRVPMADGVSLMTDHYQPTTPGSYPTVLIRTPYGRGREASITGRVMMFFCQRFAERGYHVVIQNVRGRYDSEGDFYPFVDEARDGHATLEWIARQRWFNGAVATWGPSYVGYVQWAVATSPHVKAMLPMVTTSQFHDLTYPDGVFNLDTSLRWMYLIETLGAPGTRATYATVRKTAPAMATKILPSAFAKLPMIEADVAAVGKRVDYFRDWISHPDKADAYWQRTDQSHTLADVTAPVHFMSGWYDIMLTETLADYARLRVAGKTPYLTIGGWHHLEPAYNFIGVREGLLWFDAHLKGEAGRLRGQPVRVLVMGANEWREMADWPPPTTDSRYYLHTGGHLSSDAPATPVAASHYRYDPANPTPNLGGRIFDVTGGAQDNRPLEERGDVLTFTSPALESDVEIMGSPRLELHVTSSLPHTDFFGRLCDVLPDGRSLNVCDALVRVTPDNLVRDADGSYCVTIELTPTAYRFVQGHRLRLQVSSGAHPRWTRNTGTGEPFATATRLAASDQCIHHDPAHLSSLSLPIAKA